MDHIRRVTDKAAQLLLDFIAADDRPTVVVRRERDDESRPSTPAAELSGDCPAADIIFQNAAMTEFLDLLRDKETSFSAWLPTAIRGWEASPHHDVPIAIFGGRPWSIKALDSGWIVVHCHTQFWTTAAHVRPLLQQVTNDVAAITTSSEVGEPPLERMTCDWILYPHLAVDPWAQFLVDYDWSKTALGPMAAWPEELRTRAITIMSHTEPRCLFWGDDLKCIYNEACVWRMGHAHPTTLGNPIVEHWGEATHERHTQFIRKAIREGKSVTLPNLEMLLDTRGFLEEIYLTSTYSPIPGPDGAFVGAQFDWTDTTAAVFQENRNAVLEMITARAAQADSLANLWTAIVQVLEEESRDVCYAMLFACNSSSGDSGRSTFSYVCGFGIDDAKFKPHPPPELATVMLAKPKTVHLLQKSAGNLSPDLAVEVSKGTVGHAYLLPINSNLDAPLVHLVLGMNPRRAVEASRMFVGLLRSGIMQSANMVRLPEERRIFEEANLNLVTQLRDAHAKADRNKAAIERMGQLSPAGMFVLGPLGQPQYANDRYIELLDLDLEKWMATPLGEFPYPDTFEDPEKVKTLLMSCLEGVPAQVRLRIKNQTTDGLPRWIEGMAFTETGGDGQVVSIQGWIWDISHQVFAETVKDERLREAIEHKEATANFLDMISHEIRNPLSSILLLANEVLAEAAGTTNGVAVKAKAAIKDAAETILLCAQHQKNIVDDVLELSRMDSGLMRLVMEPTLPVRMIRDTLSMFAADIKAAEIAASLKVLPGFEELVGDETEVRIDGHRVTQVLINLLTNAIKFTSTASTKRLVISLDASRAAPGSIGLGEAEYVPKRVKKVGDGAEPHQQHQQTDEPVPADAAGDEVVYLSLSVEDSGAGLTPTELASLFRRFSQASPKTYKQYGGSGLGLFISKELVELHGGQIGVASKAGQGSTFGFYIKALVGTGGTNGAGARSSSAAAAAAARKPRSGTGTMGLERSILSMGDVSVLREYPPLLLC